MSTQEVVVAGVLTKFTNLAKGWRERLFVLSNGRLMYFKLSQHDIRHVLEHFDPTGSCSRLIGAQVFLLQKRAIKNGVNGHAANGKPPVPSESYDLKVAKLRESGTESHKFYIDQPGLSVCAVKTETPDDRVAWINALTSCKVACSVHGSPYVPMDTPLTQRPSAFALPLPSGAVASARAQALRKCCEEIDGIVAELQTAAGGSSALTAQLAVKCGDMRVLMNNALSCLDQRELQVQQLMDERRMLQTELVAESNQGLPVADDKWQGLAADSSTSGSQRATGIDGAASVDGSVVSVEAAHADGGDLFYDAVETPTVLSRQVVQFDDTLPAMPAELQGLADAPPVAPAPAGALAEAGLEAAAPVQPAWKRLGWLDALNPVARRERLPDPAEVQKSVSLWSIIKECVGKDLTRVCLPVYFNEPLSALQKIAEEFEYSYLLEEAAAAPRGSAERMVWLSVFALSGYAGTGGRTCKPFNPLLGETYEYVDKQRGVRFIAEKVVHHPTILAGHCEGRGYSLDADLEVKSKFWGRCIELKPVGRIEVTFHDGEVMTWNKVTTTINNLILGKLYIEHCGMMKVASNASAYEMRVKFKDGGLLSSGKRQVSGMMLQGGHELPGYKLEGTWNESVTADLGNGPQVLWRAAPPARDPTRYNLSQFAIQLNELTPGLAEELPPTDCRLRPDQAALERGRFDLANQEKQRLEMKQRRARKEAEEGKPIHCRWFQVQPGAKRGEALSYKYAGGYWEQRAACHFTGCRDIFGVDTPAES